MLHVLKVKSILGNLIEHSMSVTSDRGLQSVCVWINCNFIISSQQLMAQMSIDDWVMAHASLMLSGWSLL